VLNWATNFFVQSLLIEQEIDANGSGTQSSGAVRASGRSVALSQRES